MNFKTLGKWMIRCMLGNFSSAQLLEIESIPIIQLSKHNQESRHLILLDVEINYFLSLIGHYGQNLLE